MDVAVGIEVGIEGMIRNLRMAPQKGDWGLNVGVLISVSNNRMLRNK